MTLLHPHTDAQMTAIRAALAAGTETVTVPGWCPNCQEIRLVTGQRRVSPITGRIRLRKGVCAICGQTRLAFSLRVFEEIPTGSLSQKLALDVRVHPRAEVKVLHIASAPEFDVTVDQLAWLITRLRQHHAAMVAAPNEAGGSDPR